MLAPQTTPPPPTVRSILDAAIESGLTTRKAICAAAEADDDQCRRWLNNQLPKLVPFRRLLGSDLVPRLVRDQLAAWFCRGTGYRMVAEAGPTLAELDADCNGRVDDRDAAAHSVAAIGRASEVVASILAAGIKTDADRAAVREGLHQMRANADRAIAAFDWQPGQACG